MQPAEIAILSAALFVFALVSKRAETGIVTPPMAFAAVGVLIGADGWGLMELHVTDAAIRRLAEVTLVLTLFSDASRIDITELDRRHAIPIRLLAIGLPLAMLAGTGAAWLMFPALGIWGAAALAIALAPTDAALGQAVVSNASVPHRIRQALNVESGLNDGLAFPALLVAASLAAGSAGDGAGAWARSIGLQVVGGPLVGALLAWLAALLIERAARNDWMDETYLRLSTLALPLLAWGAAEAMGGNGFLAGFSAGLVVAMRSERLRAAAADFGEAEGQLLTLIVFVLFGAVLVPDLAQMGWRHALFAGLALTVLRGLPVAISLLGLRLRPATVLFLGWFGPRGLASLIYLLILIEDYPIPGKDDITLAIVATVALSIFAHGMTASPLARLYGRSVGSGGTAPEHRDVPHFPLRLQRKP
ncbi:cation:proton antiporter [Limimaricola cinnabarinus]|uniref:Cation/H+ exchanger transmembrane domain-containing protein n=1 Tax=Limimaricola cinnabarinus TaxID=1125964 RepID=A0A2G1MH97_9RHOB|nr:cation:proton antiporter [Limimaricola cinnabarinus]PHP28098.1 hypothetical protein CJ301_07795 [Limimaricola cinnabarinus]